ncbi:hypothetical protein COURTHOUSE_16 [Mycobacterium phage Courthouse]|uniref:3-dehydroquinate dehydratase n=2 Tax=Omegavirus courthouse TaxID=1089119 RepID=G8I573_9CAUD|nr:glycosyltransferase [Mycobacterium phage Courthouse]AER47867.1 hypothetical protein COURTHOUSE_16 [Mycobacterium phage Courthouse]ATS92859.1 glycosyltransferase [Mycobacterium phage Superphikiman]
MNTAQVILYTFAGRRANMELLQPYVRRILDRNPNVRWEIWNLARVPEDAAYLQTIQGDRITVRNDCYNPDQWWASLSSVWDKYASDEYAGTIFVKTDDDIAFLESDRFSELVDAAADNPDSVISALTVNNGASTPLIPGINEGFERLGIPRLGVHMSNAYADMCHEWFAESWGDLVGAAGERVPTSDWVSINVIAYTAGVGKKLASLIGQQSPPHISGRDWPPGSIIGDEGACNMLPRIITTGFVAAHLTFGPQHCSERQQAAWRARYAEIAREYLA